MCTDPLMDLLLDRVCGGVEVSHRAIHGHVKAKSNNGGLLPVII